MQINATQPRDDLGSKAVGDRVPHMTGGGARSLLLADASVDLIVTSPPYYGLCGYTDGGRRFGGQTGSEETPQGVGPTAGGLAVTSAVTLVEAARLGASPDHQIGIKIPVVCHLARALLVTTWRPFLPGFGVIAIVRGGWCPVAGEASRSQRV
jgi:hypothetical protein